MGLAPYGKPIYAKTIKDNLIKIKEDGSFKLDMSFFKFHRGFRMTSQKFNKLFGDVPRTKESELKQFHMDIAASAWSSSPKGGTGRPVPLICDLILNKKLK